MLIKEHPFRIMPSKEKWDTNYIYKYKQQLNAQTHQHILKYINCGIDAGSL